MASDLVCDHCGKSESECRAAQDGHSITLVTRKDYESGRNTWND